MGIGRRIRLVLLAALVAASTSACGGSDTNNQNGNNNGADVGPDVEEDSGTDSGSDVGSDGGEDATDDAGDAGVDGGDVAPPPEWDTHSGWDLTEPLDTNVSPTHYDLNLTLDPSQEAFSGEVTIQVDIAQATDEIRLHAKDLQISSVKAVVGTDEHTPQTDTGDYGGLILSFSEQLPSGSAELQFVFEGAAGTQPENVFRTQYAGNWYMATHFEPVGARSAFPSFDDPQFRTPFKLTLNVPQAMVVVAATPEESSTTAGGTKTVTFEETSPLPTYVLGFAVGDFEVVPAPDMDGDTFPDPLPGGIPFRMLTPQGQSHLAAPFTQGITYGYVGTLTNYMGMPYPYPKLDIVALPDFPSNAMGNAGLVTMDSRLALLNPARNLASHLYDGADNLTHALTETWLGSYISIESWEHLWAQEAFTSVVATNILLAVAPDFDPWGMDVFFREYSMDRDSVAAALSLHHPIDTAGDIMAHYDIPLARHKGRSVVHMFEQWIGEDAFKQAIQSLLTDHANSTVTTQDYYDALANSTTEPIVSALKTFTDQAGVPWVDVAVTCNGNGSTEIELAQKRYVPSGAQLTDDGSIWTIPMCLRYGTSAGPETHCEMMESAQHTITLPTSECATWVVPNAHEAGYYHWDLDDEWQTKLYQNLGELSGNELLGILLHLEAGVEADKPYADMMVGMEVMAQTGHPFVNVQVISELMALLGLIGPFDSDFQAWADSLIGQKARDLGVTGAPQQPIVEHLLRTIVVFPYVAIVGDPDLINAAIGEIGPYFGDPTGKHDEVIAVPLNIGAAGATDEPATQLWGGLVNTREALVNPGTRAEITKALGGFYGSPTHVQMSYPLLLTDEYYADDFAAMFLTTMRGPLSAAYGWTWFTQNYDDIAAKLGAGLTAQTPAILSPGFCRKGSVPAFRNFFAARDENVPGMAHFGQMHVELIEQCAHHFEQIGNPIGEYFRGVE